MKLEFDIPDGFSGVEEIRKAMAWKFQALLKKHKPRRGKPGRPPHTPEERAVRARGRLMLDYYEKLRSVLGEKVFAMSKHAKEEEILSLAIKHADAFVIDSFYREQPWTRRG